MFQQFNLMPALSARDNVEAALAPMGLKRRERRGRALAQLDAVGLADRASHLPGQLSGGEQQRVAIARALVTDPRVILADEPTGSLDQAASDVIADILGSLAGENGRTVVVVTHDAGLASRAPRIVRLADGRVVADGSGGRPPGLHAVEVAVPDVAAAEAWYEAALGVDGDGPLRLSKAPRRRRCGCGWRSPTSPPRCSACARRARRSTTTGFEDPWGNRIGLVERQP